MSDNRVLHSIDLAGASYVAYHVCYYNHMEYVTQMLAASWTVFREAAIYVLFGFLVAGIMRAYIKPETVVRYFHRGRIRSVFYASLLGIPIPL
ncbi:hypothetical protein ACFL2Q_15680 [Thermodesulfobacteriota bacterium]